MPDDSTSIPTYVFLPELQYWFKKYADENMDLPLQNYLNVPEIKNSSFYIKENSIFELLFNNEYGTTIADSTASVEYDHTGVNTSIYVITDAT